MELKHMNKWDQKKREQILWVLATPFFLLLIIRSFVVNGWKAIFVWIAWAFIVFLFRHYHYKRKQETTHET
jgi:Ca2+/Na+ antiporter